MKGKGLRFFGMSILIAYLVAGAHAFAHQHEPWYHDMDDHWADQEVLTLWEEGVTDGERTITGGQQRWLFHPNSSATRAQFGLLAARVFQLGPIHPGQQTFQDLSPSYRFYGSVRPYPYIESAAADGIIHGIEGGLFGPDYPVSRQHAVAILLRALGLAPFANAQPASQRDAWLAPFVDAADIDPVLQGKVALAAHLGILRGYPDGTLRPERQLTRAEAAVIFYRSALSRLQAVPERFHPDGDGYRETTTLQLTYLANRNINRWQVIATNDRGIPVAIVGEGASAPPESVAWDGTDLDGRSLPDGIYFYEGWLEDRLGQRFHAVPRPVLLERRSLTALLDPESARSEEAVAVRAWTRGGASAVRAEMEGAPLLELTLLNETDNQQVWEGLLTLPPGDEPQETVSVQALYPGAQRQANLSLHRLDGLWVQGDVQPNPAPAGTQVTVWASTPDDAESVHMQVSGGEKRELTSDGPGTWTAAHQTAVGDQGTLPIRLTARRGSSQREALVWLEVAESPLHEVVFFLSD